MPKEQEKNLLLLSPRSTLNISAKVSYTEIEKNAAQDSREVQLITE